MCICAAVASNHKIRIGLSSRHLQQLCGIRRRGEELLRKRCGLDSPKPSVNLEDPALMTKLFHLFQGSAQPSLGSDNQEAATVAADHVLPAGVLLQSRLMNLFTKSTAAANSFPGTVQVRSSVSVCNLLNSTCHVCACEPAVFVLSDVQTYLPVFFTSGCSQSS